MFLHFIWLIQYRRNNNNIHKLYNWEINDDIQPHFVCFVFLVWTLTLLFFVDAALFLCFCLPFNLLRRLFEFRKFVSNRDTCYNLIPRDYPVQITRVRSLQSRNISNDFGLLKLRLYHFMHAFIGRKNVRMLAGWWRISYTDGAIPSRCGSNRVSTFPFSTRFATEMGRWKLQTNLHTFCWYWWSRKYRFS